MTTLPRNLLVATLLAAVGACVYEARQAAQWRSEIVASVESEAPLAGQVRQLDEAAGKIKTQIAALDEENQRLREDIAELPRLRGELSRLRANPLAAVESGAPRHATDQAAEPWVDRVDVLKQRLERTPEARIPELQLATEQDWLDAARQELKTDEDCRRALSALRRAAEKKFMGSLHQALIKCQDASGGKFPSDLSELQPYFDSPVDHAMLQRYQISPGYQFPGFGARANEWLITQRSTPDEQYDWRWGLTRNGPGLNDQFNRLPGNSGQ